MYSYSLSRKLRIGWTVVFGIACVLLMVMWLRSGSTFDSVGWYSSKGMYYSLMSQYGHLTVVKGYNPNFTPVGMYYSIGQKALEPFVGSPSEPTLSGILGLRWYSSHGVRAFRELILAVPHWMAVAACAIFAAAPWSRWRFSLRALLVATTLVAVGLGTFVWLIR
jgi:hypothetical protein